MVRLFSYNLFFALQMVNASCRFKHSQATPFVGLHSLSLPSVKLASAVCLSGDKKPVTTVALLPGDRNGQIRKLLKMTS